MSTSRDDSSPETREPSPARGRSDVPRREKKRVGFSGNDNDNDNGSGSNGGSGGVGSAGDRRGGGSVEDEFVSPIQSPTGDPFATPNPEDGEGGPEPAALRRALTRILVTEADGGEPTVPGPSRPRPALRRNTSYDAPQDREAADVAERRTTERQQRSGHEARQRADRLAVTIESYSSPNSRRGSNDMVPITLVEPSEDEEATATDSAPDTARGRDATMGTTTGAAMEGDDMGQVRARKNPEGAAEDLVRRHTKRHKKGVEQDDLFRRRGEGAMPSRPGTPTEEKAYADDYVPRPEKYHGGILGSLLKLYNEGNKESGDTSGRTTPMTATPNPSPPESRSPSQPPTGRVRSAPSSPRTSRPSSGIFGHKATGSRSSLALSELMKSTSTLIAPGASGVSGGVSEQVKSETAKHKKRKSGTWGALSPKEKTPKEKKDKKKRDDKIRITKHIAQILARHKFLLKLCRALMMYGAPTHRLEEYMTMSARVLEIEGQFLYLPNCMIISFDDVSTHTTEVKIIRIRQGIDLGKLRDVHDLYKEVLHDRVGADEATHRLDDITGRKIKFANWMRIPVYGLASACVAPFAFQGRFIDMPIAFLLGCILGFLQLFVAPNNELYANVFEITAAIITSFLARAFGSIRGGDLFCFSALAQSSIALILPGYMVLCSALELQSHNLVAGSVRMVYAMIYTLFLGYGITLGTAIYGLIDRQATSETECRDPLDRNWHLLFVPAFTLCLCIVNQAKWRQTPVMLAISLLGFLVNSYSATFFSASGNTQISNTLGALTVGILANLYSRLGRHVNGLWYDVVDWWSLRVAPRFMPASRRRNNDGLGFGGQSAPEMYQMHRHHPLSDVESRPGSPTNSAFNEDVGDEKEAEALRRAQNESADPANGGGPSRSRRTIGHGLAAAAMLPAIFVQVPSGLAAGGSLLAGVTSADQIIGSINSTSSSDDAAATSQAVDIDDDSIDLNGSAFGVLFSVIQVAIGITVGLFLSALIVYPLGKRRSGLLSF